MLHIASEGARRKHESVTGKHALAVRNFACLLPSASSSHNQIDSEPLVRF